jgi:hypothetical protein
MSRRPLQAGMTKGTPMLRAGPIRQKSAVGEKNSEQWGLGYRRAFHPMMERSSPKGYRRPSSTADNYAWNRSTMLLTIRINKFAYRSRFTCQFLSSRFRSSCSSTSRLANAACSRANVVVPGLMVINPISRTRPLLLSELEYLGRRLSTALGNLDRRLSL